MKVNSNFIVGYICAQLIKDVEPYIIKKDCCGTITHSIDIPKKWLGVKDYRLYLTSPSPHRCNKILRKCLRFLDCPTFKDRIITGKYDQFFTCERFYFVFEKKEPSKEMSIEEIEKALGHKIKLISK